MQYLLLMPVEKILVINISCQSCFSIYSKLLALNWPQAGGEWV